MRESEKFVVKRLQAKPVSYTVTISHFVSAGEWQMGLHVEGVAEDTENRERVASDLRFAADLLEQK